MAEDNSKLEQFEQTMEQVEDKIKETAALLLTINTCVLELNQPMTVILNMGELVLSEVGPDHPLAADLTTIVGQARRMSEIVKGINRLAYYE
jgi:signal transduction histidine kinase